MNGVILSLIAALSMPEPRAAGCAFYNNGKIFLIAGVGQGDTLVKRVDVLDVISGAWSNASNIPVPVKFPSCEKAGGKFFIVGGKASSGVSKVLQSYSPDSDVWHVDTMPYTFAEGGAYIKDTTLYILGGFIDDTANISSLIMGINMRNMTGFEAGNLDLPRTDFAGVHFGGLYYIFGGLYYGSLQSCLVFNGSSVSPVPYMPIPEAGNRGLGLVINNHPIVYIMGGTNEMKRSTSAMGFNVYIYYPEQAVWDSQNIAIDRKDVQAVYDSLSMDIKVFGGIKDNGDVADDYSSFVPQDPLMIKEKNANSTAGISVVRKGSILFVNAEFSCSVYLYDIQGRVLFEKKLSKGKHKLNLSGVFGADGVYFYRVGGRYGKWLYFLH